MANHSRAVGRVGSPLRVTSFDKWGRRIFEMPMRDGALAVVQGITEITPVYVRVRGLDGADNAVNWDMRLATSSIPRDTLAEIIRTAVNQQDSRARLEVVTFYLQAERYPDAHQELKQIIVDNSPGPLVVPGTDAPAKPAAVEFADSVEFGKSGQTHPADVRRLPQRADSRIQSDRAGPVWRADRDGV